MMKFENLYYNYLHRKNSRECGFNLFSIPIAKLLAFAIRPPCVIMYRVNHREILLKLKYNGVVVPY